MWFPDFPDESDQSGSVFLLAAWQELFYGFTPDSFQPRLHNVASLVDELVDIGKLWQREARFASHIKLMQAELADAIKSENSILIRIPAYRSRCFAMTKAKTPEAIVTGGRIVAEQRSFYWHAFESLARETIAELPKCKSDAINSVRRLATFAFQHGKEDDDVWDPLDNELLGTWRF